MPYEVPTREGLVEVQSAKSLGFTPEQEELLLRRSAEAESWRRKQEQLGTARTLLIGAGLVFTLTRLGDLIVQMRKRKRS